MRKTLNLLFILTFSTGFASCQKEKLVYDENSKPTISISGNGNITVVLEAGLGNWSLFYTDLVAKLNTTYKVVTINRAGYNSKVAPYNQRDVKTMAIELHDLLRQQNLGDSIVLVGHSFGGLVVREYQHLFPEKIKGLVLLDAAHPEQFERLPTKFKEALNEQIKGLEKIIKIAERGWMNSKQGKKNIPTFGLPNNYLNDYYAVTTKPTYYATLINENKNFLLSLQQVAGLPNLGALPLLVLASENSMDESTLQGVKDYPYIQHNQTWLVLQQELSTLSTNNTFISTSLANHYIHVNQPDWVAQQIGSFITNKIH